ncbi:MAG: MucR family transcriptional regulator [Alphaproteobacteria bacterium]|nr:MucR family transcriptional regulator [Alphaproteobacteria bacterium]
MTESKQADLLALTANIVAAHVSKTTVAVDDLPALIRQVHRTLNEIGQGAAPAAERPSPAVPIKKSVTSDFIVCLEDGKKLKMLKRHLKTAYNMTPEQYRERWGLASDYPMVAPNYAKKRSQLARDLGLGTKSKRKRGAD